MKTNFKNLFITIAVFSAIIIIAHLDRGVFAYFKDEGKKNKPFGEINTCEKISQIYERINQKINQRREHFEQKRQERELNREERIKEYQEKKEERRKKWDENREQFYLKLEEKSKNESQKQVLLDFKRAVEQAIKKRREEIDAANKIFQENMLRLINSKKEEIDKIAEDYRQKIKDIFDKLKEDCSQGARFGEMRQLLRNDLKTARQEFLNNKKSLDKIIAAKESLIEERRRTIKETIDNFKEAIIEARNNLKEVLK